MIKKYVAMGLGALIAIAPLAVLPQGAQAATDKTMTHSMKGHKAASHGRMGRGKTSSERARASAHHMHKKMTAPAKM